MYKNIVAISATEELSVAQVEAQMSALESEGYVRDGNITITKTMTSAPGDAPWIKAELPVTKV